MARVALVRGEDRRENILHALGLVADQVDLSDVWNVVVKPNFVSTTHQPAATHVDAVRAVLDFICTRYEGPVVVAEGAALRPTFEGYRHYGYLSLVEEYRVELVDLNRDETVPVEVYDRRLRPRTVRLARTVVESDFRISVGPPKTHDTVIVTLSIKNMVMGAIVNRRVGGVGDTPSPLRGEGREGGRLSSGRGRVLGRLAGRLPRRLAYSPLAEWTKGELLGGAGGSDKMAMHQGFPVINLNLALVASHVWPHLTVIDGWQGMEGEGPAAGDVVDWRVALAGTDPLAVDVLTAHLMGFDPQEVGYLHYCRQMGLGVGELGQIEVVGNVPPEEVRCSFAPHPSYLRQLAWHLDGVERYLKRSVFQFES